MATVTKRHLVDRIANSTGEPKHVVRAVLNEFFAEVSHEIVRGNRIKLRGFGTLEAKTHGPRIALNPRTREMVSMQTRLIQYRVPLHAKPP